MTRAGDDVAFGLENAGAARRARSGRGSTRRWPPSASRTAGTGRPRRSPAGRSSGWSSPGCWPAGRGCCCSTSPPPSSTRPARRWCGRPSPGSTADRSATTIVVDHDAGPVAAAGRPGRGGRARRPGRARPGLAARPAAAAGLRLPPAPAGPVLLTRRGRRLHLPRAATRPALPPDRRRPAGRPRARRHRPERHRASPPSRCCWPGCARPPPAGSSPAADADRRACADGHRQPHRWRAGELVTRIGTVFQHPEQQFLTGRLRDELALGPLRSGEHAAAARATAEELLERLGLTAVRRRQPVHALRRPAAPAVGRDRAGHRARGCWCSTSRRSARTRATWRELVTLLAEQRARGCAVAVVTHDADLVDVLADDRTRGCDRRLALGPRGRHRARPDQPGRAARPPSASSPSSCSPACDVVTPAVVRRRRAVPAARRRPHRPARPAGAGPGRCCSARARSAW